MRIVSRTGGVVVSTLSLHAEGPWFKSWQVVHVELEVVVVHVELAPFHIWCCILIWNQGEITHLVVHMDLE